MKKNEKLSYKVVRKVRKLLMKVKPAAYFIRGRDLLNDPYFIQTGKMSQEEKSKTPSRTEIINYLLSAAGDNTTYLEIGVRNPSHNFDHIRSEIKYGVDPGVEYEENPVEFRMTSDEFFRKLDRGEILSRDTRFDVIFIDGLHLAEQVDRDITHALRYIKEDGFVVLHDCNPPSHWHARELFSYRNSPAGNLWNGTTWKAFLKWRCNPEVHSCCIDTDWGIGIISKSLPFGRSATPVNEFYEFADLDRNRINYLNLISFDTFRTLVIQRTANAKKS